MRALFLGLSWYAIRSVYLFGVKEDGTNIFEERVVAFEAESWDEAHEKARAEADEYAEANELEAHSEQIGYEQDGVPLIDGYELWSELYESAEPLAAFYERRYSTYDYTPDPYVPDIGE